MIFQPRRHLRVVATLSCVLLFGACAESLINKRAQEEATAGQWTQALATLEAGDLTQHG